MKQDIDIDLILVYNGTNITERELNMKWKCDTIIFIYMKGDYIMKHRVFTFKAGTKYNTWDEIIANGDIETVEEFDTTFLDSDNLVLLKNN